MGILTHFSRMETVFFQFLQYHSVYSAQAVLKSLSIKRLAVIFSTNVAHMSGVALRQVGVRSPAPQCHCYC